MSKDNPIGPLSILMNRLAAEAQTEGLNVGMFSVLPNHDPDGSHVAQVVFHPIPDWGKTEEKVEDPEFDAFIKAQQDHEAKERADKARESLRDLADGLKDPSKGLGLDD